MQTERVCLRSQTLSQALKTFLNKVALVNFLTEYTPKLEAQPNDAIYVQDSNTVFHALTALPQTFEGICLNCLLQEFA